MGRVAFGRGKVTLAVLVALLLTLGGLGVVHAQKESGSNPPATLKFSDSKNVGPTRTGFAPVVKAVVPTVVTIKSTRVVKTGVRRSGRSQDQDQQVDPFFRQFFGDQFGNILPNIPDEQRSEGLGSGVIVSPEGYILTNNHVVDGATDLQVMLSDRREFKGRVIGRDEKTDIAVVKIDASNLPTITIGDSDKVEVGDYALAVGNPFGVGQTVTLGIVSATRRNNLGLEGPGAYEDFIQTDAAINPGNSGGALIDTNGNLLGINSAIYSRSGGSLGIGFAIPVSTVKTVMESIIANGQVVRGWIGVEPRNITPELAENLGLKRSSGVIIAAILKNGPADRAGMKPGDILISIGDKPVANMTEMFNQIALLAPGTKTTMTVLRDNGEKALDVTVGKRPPRKKTED